MSVDEQEHPHISITLSPEGTLHVTIVVANTPDGALPCRADAFISALDEMPRRSQLKQRISHLRVNGEPAKLATKVDYGDSISFVLSKEDSPDVVGENISLDIIYEDESIVAINKPVGMVVHPGAGNWSGTLLNALAGRYAGDDFFSQSGADPEDRVSIRPGIVHRLDKDTSGVIVVAKDSETQGQLTDEFAARRTKKTYIALVKGRIPHTYGAVAGAIGRDKRNRTRFRVYGELTHRSIASGEGPDVLGWSESEHDRSDGRAAFTTYTVLRRFPGYTLLYAHPFTGRTHQIRVHFQSISHPIVGDPIYARPDPVLSDAPLMLHAARLSINVHGKVAELRAPVSSAFRRTIQKLRGLQQDRNGHGSR